MDNATRLIALQPFQHSAGMVETGGEFFASPTLAAELVAGKMARHYDDNVRKEIAKRNTRWADAAVAILASGPSLTSEAVEAVRAWACEIQPQRRKVIVINSTFKVAPWADVLYGADRTWWDYYAEEAAQEFHGERWTQSPDAARKHGLRHIQCERRIGLSSIAGVINDGGNSGYQAIGLAADFGAREITLLGYDMQRTGNKGHHFGEHPSPLRQSSPFKTWLGSFKKLAEDLSARGIRVVNATPTTALQCFEKVALEDALRAPEAGPNG